MQKDRLEAFSDGVIAIIITIMVLELKVPHGDRPRRAAAAAAGVPQLRAELHLRRHLLEQPSPHAARSPSASTAPILWANLHLLFWLSLFPFATGWMGENHFAPLPTAVYGVVLLMAGDRLLSAAARALSTSEGRDSLLARAVGRDLKGKLSPVLYLAGIALAFVEHLDLGRDSTSWSP